MKCREEYPDPFYIPALKKTITRKTSKVGTAGSYYRLSQNTGIKIFNYPTTFIEGGRESLDKLKKAPSFKNAQKEFKNGKISYSRFKNSCKMIKFTYVKNLNDDKYYPAIILEHVQGRELSELPFSKKVYIGKHKTTVEDAESYLRSLLRKKGLLNQDVHSGNLIACKRGNRFQVMMIDFGYFKILR